jgi:hypothetical protein
MAFSVDAPFLKDALDQIGKGDIQLPDFQRGWVWDDPHITSLIASISLSYPIGAVMFLEAGGVPFKARLFEGVSIGSSPAPKTFVLDGQQRLTSMFLALKSGSAVKTRTEKGQDIEKVYFLDMKLCLDPNADREVAVASLPASLRETEDFGRKIIRDLSTPELQYSQRMFPVSLLFDAAGYANWTMAYLAHHGHSPAESQFLMQFQQSVWLRFQEYRIPVIKLTEDTPRVAVCQVFEKVNTGGVTLTVFELVTATFAVENFELRPDWDSRRKRIIEKRPTLDVLDGTAFLTAITLLASYQRSLTKNSPVSCKRADVLDLTLSDYRRLADPIQEGYRRAAELLAEQKIFDDRALPYAAQLVPLAAICAALADRIDQYSVKEKVLRWFWCGVFGELYGSANETRFALDLPQVVKWVGGDSEPRTVGNASFAPRRLLSLQSRLSAAYKGMAALLMKSGSQDFVAGTDIDLATYFDKAIDIHHIFPRVWCEGRKLKREKWNSVINKTPLAAGTNRFIGGDAPSRYLERIEKNKGISGKILDGFLGTHEIDATILRSDNFDTFLLDRASRLLNLIEAATGKAVAGRDSEETIEAYGGSLLLAVATAKNTKDA